MATTTLTVTLTSSYDQEDGVYEVEASYAGDMHRGYGRASALIDAQAYALRDLADRFLCVPLPSLACILPGECFGGAR